MNEGLFSAYESRDEWKTLTARLGQAGCTSVYEIAEGERPFLAAALRRKTGRPVVLLCSTELVAQRYAQDVERLTGEKCGVLPPRDLQFSRAASSRENVPVLHARSNSRAGYVRPNTSAMPSVAAVCTRAVRMGRQTPRRSSRPQSSGTAKYSA